MSELARRLRHRPGRPALWRAWLLAWLLCWGLAGTALAAPDGGRQVLDRGWAVLMDSEETLDPAQLTDAEVSSSFRPLPGAPSLGYVRGLQNALGTPEQTRVELMVRSATRARYAAARRKGLKLVWDLRLNVFRVSALFFFLRFATACLRCLDGRRRGIRRVS
jgi:hypothetical protein